MHGGLARRFPQPSVIGSVQFVCNTRGTESSREEGKLANSCGFDIGVGVYLESAEIHILCLWLEELDEIARNHGFTEF